MPRFLRPSDWEIIPYRNFPVIVTELDDAEYECLLWRSDDWFSQRLSTPPVSRCDLHHIGDQVWAGVCTGIDCYGTYVLALSEKETRTLVLSLGVVMGVSAQTNVLKSPNIKFAKSLPTIRYPLPLVKNELSNFNEDGAINIAISPRDLEPTNTDQESPPTEILYEPKSYDAAVSMLLEECIGTDHEAFAREFSRSAWSSGYGYVATFRRTDVYLRPGLIVSPQGIWLDAAFASVGSNVWSSNCPDMFFSHGQYGRVDTGNSTCLPDDGRPVILLSNPGLGNFAHWMMNCLFSLYLLKDRIRLTNAKVICPPLPFFARESLRFLELEQCAYELEDRYIHVDEIAYPSPLSTHANRFPHERIVDMALLLRANAQKHPIYEKVNTPALIYMTRKGFPSGRKCINEDAFVAQLTALGFVTVATHELGMFEKAAFFSRAKIIVSQIGASLTHMLFVPTGCVVVEITTPNFHSNEYWYLASLLELFYVRFMLEVKEDTFVSNGDFEFEIPLDRSLGVFKSLLDSHA